MTNAELIQAFRAEIEMRIKECEATYPKDKGGYWFPEQEEAYAIAEEYKQLLSFLGTLEDGSSEKPNTPEGLDEAAEEAATEVYTYTFQGMDDLIGLFKAGAEWAFGQGVTFISPIDYDNDGYFLDSFEQQAAAINRLGVKVMDKVIVQIRKKED